jgi:hypothetical protein
VITTGGGAVGIRTGAVDISGEFPGPIPGGLGGATNAIACPLFASTAGIGGMSTGIGGAVTVAAGVVAWTSIVGATAGTGGAPPTTRRFAWIATRDPHAGHSVQSTGDGPFGSVHRFLHDGQMMPCPPSAMLQTPPNPARNDLT